MRSLLILAILASTAHAEITVVRPFRQVAPAPQRAPYCPPKVIVFNNARVYSPAPQSPPAASTARPAWTAYSGPVFGGTVSYGSDTADVDAPCRYIEKLVILNPFCF